MRIHRNVFSIPGLVVRSQKAARVSFCQIFARGANNAVSRGSEIIVWGGCNGSYFNDTFSLTPGKVMFLYQKL